VKKLIGIIAAAAVALTLNVGCDKGKDTKDTKGGTASTNKDTSKDTGKDTGKGDMK
jgi:hypothetical protein